MAAMSHMLPQDPDDRESVLRSLRENPGIKTFAGRLLNRAQGMLGSAAMTFETRQFDEWDPPLQVVITAPIPDSSYGERYYDLLRWANSDPEYDTGKLQIILRREPTHSMAR